MEAPKGEKSFKEPRIHGWTLEDRKKKSVASKQAYENYVFQIIEDFLKRFPEANTIEEIISWLGHDFVRKTSWKYLKRLINEKRLIYENGRISINFPEVEYSIKDDPLMDGEEYAAILVKGNLEKVISPKEGPDGK